jgi:hypothetical protein
MPRRKDRAADPSSVHGLLDDIEAKPEGATRRKRRGADADGDLDLDRIW